MADPDYGSAYPREEGGAGGAVVDFDDYLGGKGVLKEGLFVCGWTEGGAYRVVLEFDLGLVEGVEDGVAH